MPLTVDYALLRSLVVYQAFSESNETATILDEKDGCNRVTLSQPAFNEENADVRFETRAHVRLGQPLGENCLMPLDWEGYLVFYQQPRIDPSNWTLSFETIDSKVYDLNRQPAKIAQALFDIVSTEAYAYMNSIRIDLSPPISELKAVFSQFFEPAAKAQSMKMLQSIRPGKTHVNALAVAIDVLMDVERYEKEQEGQSEIISGENLEHFFDQWEGWDEYLVRMLSSLVPEPLSSEERQILLDTLLEARHRFIDGLTSTDRGDDFVREQFVSAWGKIGPVFRRHLTDRPSKALMGYLSFFTVSDTLRALDKFGPDLGIELSRNGLFRLVRLFNDLESEEAPDVLTYRMDVNIPLREVLGLGPPLPAQGPSFDPDDLERIDRHDSQMEDIGSFAGMLGSFLCSPAFATQKSSADALAEIKTWLYSGKNLESYVDRIQSLLIDSARSTLKRHKYSREYQLFFPRMVVATAWQESCFRQFLVKNKKIVYLRSYNRSSVGLMQINERVWRGMYDTQLLRWDIRYNALAGCEIIDLYATKYMGNPANNSKALQKTKDDTRAGIIYAMYNGGPGQLEKYLTRSARGKRYDSDNLFMEKYVWVKNGQLANIDKCLIGR